MAAPTGYALSFASLPGQRRRGLDRPVLDRLDDRRHHPAHDGAYDGAGVAPLRQPRVGAGLAFTLNRRLAGPGFLGPEITTAVGLVAPALVFLDPPDGAGPPGTADAGTGDSALAGTGTAQSALAGVVLGAPRPAGLAELRLTGCLLYRNGELAGTGAGGALLGSPVDALVRLIDTAGGLGWPLEAGQTLVVSSMVPEPPVEPGDLVTLQVAGFAPVSTVVPGSGRGGATDD